MTTWQVTAVHTTDDGSLDVSVTFTLPHGTLVEDFIFAGRRPTTSVPVTDAIGRVQTPTGWVLPWKIVNGRWTPDFPADAIRHDVPWDVAASVTRHATARAKHALAHGHVGDHRDPSIKRGTHDPHGVLAHAAGIVGLKGTA